MIMAWKRLRVDSPGRLAAALAVAALLGLWPPRLAFAWGTDNEEMAREIAAMLSVGPGGTVAEIGAGHGEMAVRMARIVGPTGRVYATEIDPERVEEIRKRAADAGVDNITVIEAAPTDTGLPEGCCDGAYMIGVYHHVTDPAATDASIFRALKPGARLVVNDFPPTIWLSLFKVQGVPANRGGHGVADHIVIDEMKAAGFNEVKEMSPWHPGFFIRDNYCLVFARDGAATAASR
jgi:precorrin-6B methylase 2